MERRGIEDYLGRTGAFSELVRTLKPSPQSMIALTPLKPEADPTRVALPTQRKFLGRGPKVGFAHPDRTTTKRRDHLRKGIDM